MEKIKIFILKSPVIMAIITFASAFILAIILKLFLGLKNTSLETTIIPMAISMPILYKNKFKEQISKTYKIIYALTTTLFYILFNFLMIFLSPVFSHSKNYNFLINATIMESIIIFFCIYFIIGRVGKRVLKYDFQKMAEIQKNMPVEIKKERRTKFLITFSILFSPMILLFLSHIHIISLDKNIKSILALLFIVLVIVSPKYLKKENEIYFPSNENVDKN